MASRKKVVLAYSGGLDTSVAVRWIGEKYNLDVVAVCVDIGTVKDLPSIQEKALKVGAVKSVVINARDTFINDYVYPALTADAVYEGQYPLATALGRPLIVKIMVDIARQEKAVAVAHGSTGKGNDQVRFDAGTIALAPDLKIIAPAREWGMTREQTMAYAKKHGIPVPVTIAKPYSIDENLWGRSIESGILEDPMVEPPEDIYGWTKPVSKCPEKPAYVEIGFEKGIPVSLNGRKLGGVALVQQLNKLAGDNGVGRIDHIESRLVGIKSREIYEAPAAVTLVKAHLALEAMTMTRQQLRFKERVAQEYSELVYNGLWFSAFKQELDAYVKMSQRFVSGTVRVRLHKGNCTVVGRKSDVSLYSHALATYDKGDAFDQSFSPGFIQLWALPSKIQTQKQTKGKY
jgi:argininosuccinate synthase